MQERKYFDSGDYALSKAGKASDVGVTQVGNKHPLPENIPHVHSPSLGNNSPVLGATAASPIKENQLVKSPMGASEPTTAMDEEVVTPGESLPPAGVDVSVPERWRSQS